MRRAWLAVALALAAPVARADTIETVHVAAAGDEPTWSACPLADGVDYRVVATGALSPQLLVDDGQLWEVPAEHLYAATVRGAGRRLKLQIMHAPEEAFPAGETVDVRIEGPGPACAVARPVDLRLAPTWMAPPGQQPPPRTSAPPL